MGTDVDSFKQKMLQKNGFKDHPLPYNGMVGVDGTFSGQEASFSIIYTSKSRIVEAVMVTFPALNFYTTSDNADDRNELLNGYHDLFKAEIIKKYGPPSSEPSFEGQSLKNWCQWDLTNGTIDLYVTEHSNNPHYRMLYVVYSDKLSVEQEKKENSSDW